MNLSRKSKKYVLIVLITHVLAAFFSVGFFNLDEQTQVLQLVGYKIGNYGVNYLSDQYFLAIRSWFHPAIYLLCSKILLLFFSFNPFVHAFFYRLLSTAVGMLSLGVLYKTFEDEIQAYKAEELFWFFAAFLWFFPFLHARPANENLCASFFIFGLYYLRLHKNRTYFFLAGLFFGLSFITRFQMIVMIASSVLWSLIFTKEYKKTIFLVSGLLLILVLSTLFDSYMYGHLTFTPYNYFYVNILQKYASSFGVTPFYQYFIYCFRECLPPLAIIVILSYLYLWLKFPKHILTWITLPFFIVHSLIGHKEFRFLFPMAPFLPMVLIVIFHSLRWENKKNIRTWFLVFNVPLLIYFSFSPAASTNRYFKFLYDHETVIRKVYVFSFYEDNSKFYLKNDIEYSVMNSEQAKEKIKSDKQTYFLTKNISERNLIISEKNCHVTFSLYPEWIYEFEFIKKRRTFRSWSFIECIN